ncbi:MAG: hypothetical protein FD174_547 [Geobacteraceae bacterium]|nr:MAG: hypothetical protein FD174_547 [Geobacteraceae bacterium]
MNRLHTDLLQEAYGPVSIRLLRHDNEVREAHLVDRQGISRTFAVTFLAPPYPQELARIDAEIREGAPIGKTFRRYGYEVRKNVLKALAVELPAWLRNEFAHPSLFAKALLSEFLARVDARPPELYGTVVEIYSPDFRSPAITETDRTQEGPTLKSLGAAGIPPDEAWQRLGGDPAYDRADPRYLVASNLCHRDIIFMIKRLAALLERGQQRTK